MGVEVGVLHFEGDVLLEQRHLHFLCVWREWDVDNGRHGSLLHGFERVLLLAHVRELGPIAPVERVLLSR